MSLILSGTDGLSDVDGSAATPAIRGTDANTGIFFPAADTIAFSEGGVESMRITSAGDVGIGTASPNTYTNYKTLSIFGTNGGEFDLGDGANTRFSLFSQTTATQMYTVGAIPLILGTNSVERMRILSGGSIGINTSSPTTTLTVDVKSNSYTNGIDISNSNSWGYGSSINFRNIPTNGGSLTTVAQIQQFFEASNKYSLSFSTYNSSLAERMRITSDGYLKASNTGVYVSPTGIYHEMISDGDNTSLIVRNTNGSLTAGGVLYVDANRNTTNNAFYAIAYYNNGAGAYKFQVADSGNVTNTNNSYGAISDVKLKENIVDASPKLKDLCKVKVRQYNLKSDPDHKQIGVVAQELEEVFAGLVEETADKDREGNYLGTTTKQVKYSVFVPMLIKAMQEQQALIENLTTRLNALEGK
jgi:hypothetical protein